MGIDLPNLAYDQWSLAHVFELRCNRSPDAPFLGSLVDAPLSFGEARKAAKRIAEQLVEQGVQPGDHVAVVIGDPIASVLVWLAVAIAGAVDAPIDHGLRGRTLDHALRVIKPFLVVTDNPLFAKTYTGRSTGIGSARLRQLTRKADGKFQLEPSLTQNVEETKDRCALRRQAIRLDVSSILFTSGSSGLPKGVLIPNRQAMLTGYLTSTGLRLNSDDIFYCCHPLFHMAAKHSVIIASILSGSHVCLDERFQAEKWLANIRRSGASVTIAHGPMVEMVYQLPAAPDDRDNPLQRFTSTPFPRRIASQFEQRFGVRGIEVWGMTEVGVPCWSDMAEPLMVGSCGRLQETYFDLRLVDSEGVEAKENAVGEIAIRPKVPGTITPGYLGDPVATKRALRDGWFFTGDLAVMENGGNLRFVDRKNQRIRRRGKSISSAEIEGAAIEHPMVAECAAAGVASAYEHDDDVILYVVRGPNDEFDPVDVLRHLARELPHYMLPRFIRTVRSLPRTSTNKIQKSELPGLQGELWDRQIAKIRIRDLISAL